MEYALLTNIIHEEWSGLSVKDHKNLKGLKTQNLRDHNQTKEKSGKLHSTRPTPPPRWGGRG
jgi:hypothetical protein